MAALRRVRPARRLSGGVLATTDQYDHHMPPRDRRPARHRPADRRGRPDSQAQNRKSQRRRSSWSPTGGQLPRWVSDDLARVTPKARLAAATASLLAAATHFAAGKYGKALAEAENAKALSSRDATIREILALSAYRLGKWDQALRELRTFRRFTGETTHMPVEMDVLRALDRPDDVAETWKAFRKLGGRRETRDEAKVVYGSFLLDTGDARQAWEVTNPKRIDADSPESALRVWYVASKAAQRLGDSETARRLFEAIEQRDAAFPGLDELGRILRND